jgi:hypothetical protein
VLLDAATKGPGWTPAGGGWTGDGCDGSSVWTMDPNGNQAIPSALTWFFTPAPAVSRCTLAVFVPTQNALGEGEYAISSPDASLGTVDVGQAAAAGQWVTLGTYPATGPLYIQFIPAVTTLTAAIPGPGNPHGQAHQAPPGHNSAVAASAASATCDR